MATVAERRAARSRQRQRCAIYTRKSTDEGLDQAFNSLDAQREACAAYIASQAGEAWFALPARYDDGGFSGGSMERPALGRLLADVEAGLVDIVVVYKVDRLTRSLADFAKIVERFEAHGVAFVSVTQAFNTTSSMGRLTLNVLLSFAQFEREVTAERIRDKIAASKAKGMWMGGLPPLGHDALDKRLVVNEAEADTVRTVFALYLEAGSLRTLKAWADARGIVTKRRQHIGVERGGLPFSVGHLRQLLTNPLYVGKVRHKGELYDGQHEAVVPQALFGSVQTALRQAAPSRRMGTNTPSPHRLTGLIFDDTGDRLSPADTRKKGVRYHYYVSRRLVQQTRSTQGDGWRLPAKMLDDTVAKEMARWLRDPRNLFQCVHDDHDAGEIEAVAKAAKAVADQMQGRPAGDADVLKRVVHRVIVSAEQLTVTVDRDLLRRMLSGTADRPSAIGSDPPAADLADHETVVITVPWSIKRRGCERKFVISADEDRAANPDPHLVELITTAHRALALLTSGTAVTVDAAAKILGADKDRISRSLRLAFLAPDITAAILSGRQPVDLTARTLFRIKTLPNGWVAQRRLLGFPPPR
ncbi:MAG: recombinase family protein [Devosia sp.]